MPSITPSLSHSPAYCTDFPEWSDSVGWTCALYESIENACFDYGDSDTGVGGLTANEACCGKLYMYMCFNNISKTSVLIY